MSHYADYKKEFEGYETIEDDNGFINYLINGDICYIQEVYVVPDKRKLGIMTEYAVQVENIAKEKGCKKLLGSVVPGQRDATYRMKAVMSFGFKLQSSQNNFIWLEKEIL